MTDPRVAAYARLLVGRSIAAQPGDQVLVATTSEARPLAEQLSRELATRGAYALTRIAFGGLYPLDVAWFEAAPPELGLTIPPLEQEVVDRVDGAIFVLAPEDPPRDADLSPNARRAYRSQFTAYRARGRAGLVREVRCDFPTPHFARQASLSLAEYEDVFYDACLRDWDAEGERMRPVLARFDRAGEIRIVGEDTDLTLSLTGRSGAIDDGHANVPGGEVYYSPVEDSAEGTIRFDFRSGRVEGARLVFQAGEVVEATADAARTSCTRRSRRTRAHAGSASSGSAATKGSRATSTTSCSTRRWPARSTSRSAPASRASAVGTRARCTGTSSRT